MAFNLTHSGALSTHPRLLVTRAQIPGLASRVSRSDSWASVYTSKIKPYADTLVGYTDANFCSDSNSTWERVLVCGVVALVEYYRAHGTTDPGHGTSSTYWLKIASAARWIVANKTVGASEVKNWLMSLALALDFCWDYGYVTESDKKSIGEKLIDWCDNMQLDHSPTSTELMDGSTAAQQGAQIMGALALYGHVSAPAGYDFTTGTYSATTRLNEGIAWWFGASGADANTTNGYAGMDMFRYYSANGGGTRGAWYYSYALWKAYYVLLCVQNALVSPLLGGDAFTIRGSETWTQNAWKWLLTLSARGDGDFWTFDDSGRISNPVFDNVQRVAIGLSATFAAPNDLGTSTGSKCMRWLWDQKRAYEDTKSQYYGLLAIHDFLSWDPHYVGTYDMTSIGPKLLVLDPPGVLSYRSSFNQGQSTQILIDTQQFYYRGHPHLKRGAIHICHKKDIVCGTSGFYKVSPSGNPSDYGGDHHRNYYQQTIAQSGVILVDDGSATPHENTDIDGNYVARKSGLGGQYWKKYGSDTDPDNTWNMRQDDSGNAWRCCEGSSTSEAATLLSPEADPDVIVYYSNLRRAYLLQSSDYAGGAERVRRYDSKWMIIKDFGGLGVPAILMVARVESRLSSMTKRQIWHFWNLIQISSTLDENSLTVHGESYNVTGDATAPGLRIDYYNPSAWTTTVVGGGTATPTTPGSFDFYFSGDAHTPLVPIPSYYLPDVQRVRVEVSPANAATEHYFVCLIRPLDQTMTLPNWNWTQDADWYGIQVGGKAYKLHKTNQQYLASGDPVDTNPPQAPTGLAATTPASGVVELTCTANTEPDIFRYNWYKRQKV